MQRPVAVRIDMSESLKSALQRVGSEFQKESPVNAPANSKQESLQTIRGSHPTEPEFQEVRALYYPDGREIHLTSDLRSYFYYIAAVGLEKFQPISERLYESTTMCELKIIFR